MFIIHISHGINFTVCAFTQYDKFNVKACLDDIQLTQHSNKELLNKPEKTHNNKHRKR